MLGLIPAIFVCRCWDRTISGAMCSFSRTAEQIYLLLRVVLAERLTTAGETCPLLLDDVLVQCDQARKRALLNIILAISRTQQVILFMQEQEVLQWAQQNVVSPDQLVMLPGTS